VLRPAADENLHGAIVRALRRRMPTIDLVRVQDAGLIGADDVTVLEWAAREGRVLLSHDENTLIGHARDFVDSGRPMAGLFHVGAGTSLGQVIDDLILLVECSLDAEWEGQVRFLPL
jgi:hypothetical protein